MGASKQTSSCESNEFPGTPAGKAKEQHAQSYYSSNGFAQYLPLVGVIGYATIGLGMGFSNKAVLMYFPFSNLLLMLQMIAAVLIISFLSISGLIFIRPLELNHARRLFPLVFLYNANVCFALAGLRILNIPMYNCLKRLTPVTVLVVKRIAGSPWPPKQVVLAVLTVVGGCIIAGLGDLTFDLAGYALALTSCLLHACYLVVVESSGGEKGFTSSELLLYNALLSLPILIPFTFLTGEVRSAMALVQDRETSPLSASFLVLIVVSLIMGVLLNYIIFLCTLANSALTTTIVGALRSVLSTVLGFFVLGGVEVSFLNVTGIVVNSIGGLWYTAAKYQLRAKRTGGRQFEVALGSPPKSSDSNGDVEGGRPLLHNSS